MSQHKLSRYVVQRNMSLCENLYPYPYPPPQQKTHRIWVIWKSDLEAGWGGPDPWTPPASYAPGREAEGARQGPARKKYSL